MYYHNILLSDIFDPDIYIFNHDTYSITSIPFFPFNISKTLLIHFQKDYLEQIYIE